MPKARPADKSALMPRLEADPLITAAWLYYQENHTQAEIAGVLGLSRPTVANLLSRARDEGIVTVHLRPDVLRRLSSASALREHFGLHDALVVPNPNGQGGDALARSLGRAAALYLEGLLRPGDILGTAWGSGLQALAEALTPRPIEGLRVTQSLGGLLTSDAINPARIAWTIAEKLGAHLTHLHAPQYVASPESQALFLREPTVRAALDLARSATLMVLGIGGTDADATAVRAGVITPGDMAALRAAGAVGDLSGRYYDLQGQPVETDLGARLIALTLDDLRGITPVIAVAGGPSKTRAILGALRTGCLDVLVTDERTAAALLAEGEPGGS